MGADLIGQVINLLQGKIDSNVLILLDDCLRDIFLNPNDIHLLQDKLNIISKHVKVTEL